MQTALSIRSLATAPATPNSSCISAERATHLSQPSVSKTRGLNNGLRLRFDDAHARKCDACVVEPAIHGNHFAIQRFLQRTLHRPTLPEFNSAAMRPDYEPSERLIIKNPEDKTIVGHVQIELQTIRFGGCEIPVARFRDLAVLEEYRQQGFDDVLLAAAEAEAKRKGAMLLLARGEDFRLLKKSAWCVLGSDPVSIVSPQCLKGQLPAPAEPESPFYADKMPQWEVRIGRLTDVEPMSSIYDSVYANVYGSLQRSDEKWSWLLSKQAHDRVYLFIEDGVPLAYVVVRGGSVMELADMTEDARGSARLLERVGADAIEQGRYSLRLHCPLTSPAHVWADDAGGQVFAATVEDSWMVKITSKRTLLRRLAHEVYRRKPKGLTELGIRIGNEELLVRKGVRSMKVTRGKSKEHHIGLTNASAAGLFLGYRTAAELKAGQELVASSPEALRMANELFPAVMLWRTQWDDATVISR